MIFLWFCLSVDCFLYCKKCIYCPFIHKSADLIAPSEHCTVWCLWSVSFPLLLLINKKFTGMTLFPCQQEIENQLSRPGVSYENRVSAVLSGWEHLAGTVESDVGQLQPLASFLYR